MKLDDMDDFRTDLFQHHTTLMKLERQLFAHMLELGNLRSMAGFEQVLYCVLSDEIDEILAMDLSRVMVAHAAERVIRDPMRDISSVPHGVSRAERMAAFFEEGCPFCQAKVDLLEETEDGDDDCPCCSMLVKEWRAKHAEALRRSARACSAS